MPMHRAAAAAVIALAALSGWAAGDLVTITLNAPSGIDLELCQDLPIVGGCDSDASPIVGTAMFEVDTGAGTVVLVDFVFTTTQSLDYTYTGLLSVINASAPSVDVFYDGAGPTAPVPLVGDAFDFAAVPVNLAGTATVTGSILGAGAVNESINFADFGPFISDLAGMLSDDGTGNYALDASIAFDETTVGDVMGITVTTTATGVLTLVGTGTAVPSQCNPADLDANGALNLDDIDAFVAAFLAGCP